MKSKNQNELSQFEMIRSKATDELDRFYLVRAHRSNRICALFSVLDSSWSKLSVFRNYVFKTLINVSVRKQLLSGTIQPIKAKADIKKKNILKNSLKALQREGHLMGTEMILFPTERAIIC
jgi:hypothetical protein